MDKTYHEAALSQGKLQLTYNIGFVRLGISKDLGLT